MHTPAHTTENLKTGPSTRSSERSLAWRPSESVMMVHRLGQVYAAWPSGQADLNTRTERVGGQEPRRPEGCINLGEFTVKNRDLLKGQGDE